MYDPPPQPPTGNKHNKIAETIFSFIPIELQLSSSFLNRLPGGRKMVSIHVYLRWRNKKVVSLYSSGRRHHTRCHYFFLPIALFEHIIQEYITQSNKWTLLKRASWPNQTRYFVSTVYQIWWFFCEFLKHATLYHQPHTGVDMSSGENTNSILQKYE